MELLNRVRLQGKQLLNRICRPVLNFFLHFLTTPIKAYSPGEQTDLEALSRRVKPGDVLLISGAARISYIVKLLTLSQWSHVVLYVGNRSELLPKETLERYRAKFEGVDLEHLVIDADPTEGVHLKPLMDFKGLMVRQCRPTALSRKDTQAVLEHALATLGRQYDIWHIVKLLFFFAFPWELLPQSLRKYFRDFSLSESDTICSRVLAEAFHSVGYPIRPYEVISNRATPGSRALSVLSSIERRGTSALKLLSQGRIDAASKRMSSSRYMAFKLKGTRHITPADYDLSRFFDIIKNPADLKVRYSSSDEEGEEP